MTYVALALLGFGIADLVRWSPEGVQRSRAAVAAAAGAAAVVAVAALGGMETSEVVAAGAVAAVVLSLWSAYDAIGSERARPEYPIALVLATILILVGVSGSADPVAGKLEDWYENLDFGFRKEIPLDQFVLGFGATCFLLATGNRVVRYFLLATEASLLESEDTLRGGRVLGPMERIIVAASVLSGNVAGAGFVIAAKGLLRFREIRRTDEPPPPLGTEEDSSPKVDEITEYFLIGTFTSVLIAAVLAILVLACT